MSRRLSSKTFHGKKIYYYCATLVYSVPWMRNLSCCNASSNWYHETSKTLDDTSCSWETILGLDTKKDCGIMDCINSKLLQRLSECLFTKRTYIVRIQQRQFPYTIFWSLVLYLRRLFGMLSSLLENDVDENWVAEKQSGKRHSCFRTNNTKGLMRLSISASLSIKYTERINVRCPYSVLTRLSALWCRNLRSLNKLLTRFV